MDDKTLQAFQALAKELEANKGGTGNSKFLARGDNVIRLLVEPGRSPVNFAEECTTYFNGKPGKKFMVFALVLQAGDHKAEGDEAWTVVPLVIPPKVRGSIVNTAAKGYDLFTKDGYGVVITRSGSGKTTGYETLPTAQPMPYDPAKLIKPEKNLKAYADEYSEWQRQRAMSDLGSTTQETSLGSPAAPAAPSDSPASGW